MAVVKMKRLTLVGLDEDKVALINALTRLKAVEIQTDEEAAAALAAAHESLAPVKEWTDAGDYEDNADSWNEANIERSIAALFENDAAQTLCRGFSAADYRRLQTEAAKRAARLREMALLAEKLNPAKKPRFHVRRAMTESEFIATGLRQSEIMSEMDALSENRLELQRLRGEQAIIEGKLKLYTPLADLKLPRGMVSAQRGFRFFAGTVLLPKTGWEGWLAALQEQVSFEFVIQKLYGDKKTVALLAAVPEADAPELERVLRAAGLTNFPELPADMDTDYARAIETLRKRSEDLEKRAAVLDEDARGLSGCQKNLELLHDYYTVAADKLEALQKLLFTGRLVLLHGYVPERSCAEFERVLKERFPVAIWLEDIPEGESFPVALHNPRFIRHYEAIIDMFSLPKPGSDLDPTAVMSPFYALLYGMMLSDVGYGLLIVIFTSYVVFKVKVEGMMRKMCLVFLQGGVIGIIFGFLFGGFFGNLPAALTGNKDAFKPLWFDPLNDPMKMLLVCVAVGAVHIFVGLGVKLVTMIQLKQAWAGFVETVPWYLIICGLTMAALNISWAIYMAAVGAAIVVFCSAIGERNPIKRVFSGLGKLYGITGYLGDLLSYSRVLALSLATAVIAMVVNIFSTMSGFTVAGVIIFIIIMPLGHVMNLALSGLSCYVHTTRLQYVEYFGKFYEGGGEAFAPLGMRTRYVRVTPDEQLAAQGKQANI